MPPTKGRPRPMMNFRTSAAATETSKERKMNCSRVPRPSNSARRVPFRPAATRATATSATASTDSTYSSLPKSVRMRIGHRPGVPRAGINWISAESNATIRTMITAAPARLSHSECRASLRAASARRECEGVRTSCASACQDTAANWTG
ncbi:hypothetical protein AXW67_20400 [Bradyrhizobium neotropicale]|uniref:Uncharacterized protein n=1 Tax=Bradyrhizobium neotropicale TaxID=1497615 RepID=A0A176YW65_9BRAD|nr:hypothetical protein AXW67_20400 [Bradyrhizobium neotropicale]